MGNVLRVARKELWAFFSSPVAYIFLGAFLAVSLFVFFWVDTFFARNIADVRPLFEWMPLLLIFLVAALTMRQWSEERRAGTLENLMTLPVSTPELVLGKFLASLALVTVALLLTLPLPVTVAVLGPLDWGPVAGGYLAAVLLAAAYIAVGLFVSARTDNAIVSLIGTALLCGLFYLIGSDALTHLLGHRAGEVLQRLGTGSRFESITRGVIDLRDLYYYLSIVGTFLTLNVYVLERLRWAPDSEAPQTHRRWGLVTALFVANFLAGNLWLGQIGWARLDVTEGQVYSISDATRRYLGQLQEPLLIRGYFSAQTHPLLSPLVPQIRDLLREYEVAGGGKVRVEFLDPHDEPEIEREANEKYGIRPVAFQSADKYQASVVNSYFDVLVQYGDQFQKLGFRDLIEVKVHGERDLEVRLRNPEYDVTGAIKKVLYAYQAGGDLFASLDRPVVFRGFISADARLPEPLPELRQELVAVLEGLRQKSGGRLTVDIRDPDAGDGALAREIAQRYGFQPLALSLLDPTSFYFYMLLESGEQTVPVSLPETLDRAGLERAVSAGLKRLSPGFLRTIAVYAPAGDPRLAQFGMGGPSFELLRDKLGQEAALRDTDLRSGRVPDEADLLLVLAPESLDEKQVFAIDQFVMQGGTVILAASPFHVELGRSAISARPQATGLEAWLEHHGVKLEQAMVLDPQNTPFPIPVQRRVGGFVVQEVRSLAYPYFPDVRPGGMAADGGITAGLGQVTLTWPSPITVDRDKNRGRTVTELLRSSPESWTSPSPDIQPDFTRYGATGFARGEPQGPQLLGVVLEGSFTSFFKGKPSPLLATEESTPGPGGDTPEESAKGRPALSGFIDVSPASSRVILLGSATFLTDAALDLAADATGTRYLKPVQLVQNAVDWSLEDRGLLALRGRGQYSRLLEPMDRNEQAFWEYLNYGLALAGLALLYALHRRRRRRRQGHYREVLNPGRA